MKLGKWGKVGLPLFAVAGVGAAVIVAACSSKKDNPPEAAGSCATINPGEFQVDNCQTTDNSGCKASPDPSCPINAAKCGDPNTCLPMGDNKGKQQLDFRIRLLNVQSPPALNTSFVQASVVTKNIDLTQKECGDNGNGAFNWLLRVDLAANKLVTGGAPPTADPFGVGYCFYNHVPPSSKTNIQPLTVDLIKNADGSYSGKPGDILNVPIFLNGELSNVIILPISQATIHSLTVSNDGNCIGKFNPGALGPQCGENADCDKWATAGSLGGFITLEAADTVSVADLQESLCVLLTSSTKDPTTSGCQREGGKIKFKGDYCSTSQKPGDCQDSFWMAATFAASAVKIHDGSTVDECKAGVSPPVDGGADGAADSSTDSGTNEDSGNTVTDAGGTDSSADAASE